MLDKSGEEIRLRHILDTIGEIESHLELADFDSFMDNAMMRFACIKQMEIIGEASNHISSETKNNFSKVEWAQIVGMRNVFVHEYFGVAPSLVWDIIKNDVPNLKENISKLIASPSNTRQ